MFYNVDDAQADAPASETEADNFEDSDENDNAARGQTSRGLLIISQRGLGGHALNKTK